MAGTQQSRQPNLIALCTVMITLSTAAVLLRLWGAHIQQIRTFGWDDFSAIATLPFIWAENAVMFWWISLGFGRHAVDLPASRVSQVPKIGFIAEILNNAALAFPKFAALFFYHRVFAKTNLLFHRILWFVGFLNAAWVLSAMCTTLFRCNPIQKAWNSSVEGRCLSNWDFFLGTALCSTAIDISILVLPLPMLWRLRMSNSRKALITGVFVCGYAVVVVSVGRLIALTQARGSFEEDATWGLVNYVEWVQCEAPISLISVCLPNIFQLAKDAHHLGFRYLFTGRPCKIAEVSKHDTIQKPQEMNKTHSTFVRLHNSEIDSELNGFQYGGRGRVEANAWSKSPRMTSGDDGASVEETPSVHSRDDRIYVRSQIEVESV